MNSNHKLAIVIPAYKIAFFKESIESIANQTCKDFTLYIGDDASPSDFNEIINAYKDKINIIYERFEKNLGGTDLAAHWNRCIDMIQNEEWIWLFSDDDLMENNCVELFYKHIKKHKDDCLLHFNIQVINEKNIKIYKTIKFQPHLSTIEFFSKRLNSKINSYAVEYIFKREIFEKVDRFESFDLAWASDDATWLKLSVYNGINTIDGALVKWRQSALNISPRSDSITVVRKLNATLNYLNWVKQFFNQNNLIDISTQMEKASCLIRIIAFTSSLTYRKKYKLIIYIVRTLNFNKIKLRAIVYWLFLELKENMKLLIRYNEFLIAKS